MTIYEELGMTPDQLLAEGQRILNSVVFRNEPYEHYVFVIGSAFEFAAIAHYAKANLGHDPMLAYERYMCSAGLTVNWNYLNNTYSMVCVHMDNLKHYAPGTMMSFLGTLVHEQQHMLVRSERVLDADYRDEDEPRTYATASTLQKILMILRANYNVHLVAVPKHMVPRIRVLDEVSNVLGVRVTSVDIYSGVMRQYMEHNTGTVFVSPDGWHATTYISGGEHV